MTPETKSILLKRKFESINYIEQFVHHYQRFIDTGLDALSLYKSYKMDNSIFIPNNNMSTDEWLWDQKVKPNFLRMRKSSEKALSFAKKNNMGYIRGLAGDFRGLSKSMDGIRESFMDVLDPKIKEEYLSRRKSTDIEAHNIEKTINNWWKPASILDEEITGPIDEKELLNYLKPGESIS